ncbi:hypothetical protein [Deinococcus ruber]|uniref:hypothetical protein n=1 Tax=Deinococcus ruber TaxID=1848197 RepID=UPI001667F4D7|nr:hypothetical protein [Deinococcus ruber]
MKLQDVSLGRYAGEQLVQLIQENQRLQVHLSTPGMLLFEQLESGKRALYAAAADLAPKFPSGSYVYMDINGKPIPFLFAYAGAKKYVTTHFSYVQ